MQSSVTPTVKTPTQFLYRLRDADGVLLYVGVTNDWPSRFKQHSRDKAWFNQVVFTEAVPVGGNRAQLEAIEKAVIVAEKPLHNVAHNALTGRASLGSRSAKWKHHSGRTVIQALASDPITWQLNDSEGRCMLLLKVGDWLEHDEMGWGRVANIRIGGDWLTTIDYGIEGAYTYSLLDDGHHLREPRQDEWFTTPPQVGDDQWGRLVIGSYCRHSSLGHGQVLEREQQRRFLVRFLHCEQWIDRNDPLVEQWGQ